MRTQLKRLATATAFFAVSGGAAQASILGVSAPGGTEAILNVVNNTDSSSMSQDIGVQPGGLHFGDQFDLGPGIVNFINSAGGLGGVHFSLIAGSAASGTSASTYLQSSANSSLTNIANGVRGTWDSNLDAFTRLRLNASNPGDTDTSVNATYGPFASGVSGNYITAGTDDWGTAGVCTTNPNVCNTVGGTLGANLFLVNFGTAPTGFASIAPLLQSSTDFGTGIAQLNLAGGHLFIGSTTGVVPVPAAAWLLGSAMSLLGLVRRRQATQ